MVFHPRLALAEKGVTGITARTLPGGLWRLVCGELTGETGEVTVMGQPLSITKGGAAAAGRLTGKFLAREHFTQLAAESDARVRKELRTDPQCAPFLTAATAFIVLEEEWQYKQFGIPLPPDLTRDVRTSDGAQERSEREGFVEFDRALRRPAGTAGDPAEWHSRVRSHSKRAELSTLFGNRSRFEERRQTFGTLPPHISWVAEDAAYLEAVKKARQAGLELSRLSRAYQDAPTSQAEQLIRAGRAQQQAAMQRTELLTEYFEIGLLRSGGAPGADPFGGPAEMAELNTRAADPFASADVGTGGGPGGGTASAEPFGPPPAPPAIVPPAAAPAPAPSETPAAPPPPSSSTPQVPQTFGGSGGWPWGGDIFADGRNGSAGNQTSGAGAEHSARQARAAYKDAALARATALLRRLAYDALLSSPRWRRSSTCSRCSRDQARSSFTSRSRSCRPSPSRKHAA